MRSAPYGPGLTVSVVSESSFTVRDHGVHTAFVEQVRALRQLGALVSVNERRACRRAHLTAVHTPGPFGRACLRAAGATAIVYAHVTPATLAESLRFERGWRRLARAYLKSFYGLAPAVVAVSSSVRDELLALGVEARRIRLIPNGIEGERIAAGADPDLERRLRSEGRAERPLVLGVGQLQPRKGIDAFIAVARILPECHFVWVGGRPFGALTAAVDVRSAPPNLRFAGRVSDRELLAYYHAADVFLFPSRQENFGQVVVEAAAAGLPLVLSDLPVFRENFGDCAILATDLPELAGVVATLCADSEFRAERSAAARSLATRFSAVRGAQALLDLAGELPPPPPVQRAVPA